MEDEVLLDTPLTPSEPPPSIDIESDIDLSTLRLITGTLRHTFLPYLGWIIAFTSFAKFTRFFSPFLFRFTRWTGDWLFWMIEKLVQFFAWSCMWLGMAAAGLWLIGGGALLILPWGFIKLRPIWRQSMQKHPIATRIASKVVKFLVLWYLIRRIAGRLVSNLFAVMVVGWVTYVCFKVFVLESSTTDPITPPLIRRRTSTTSDKEDGEQDKEDEEQAERWAREVTETMLKESLLKKGRTTGNGNDKVEAVETDIHEID